MKKSQYLTSLCLGLLISGCSYSTGSGSSNPAPAARPPGTPNSEISKVNFKAVSEKVIQARCLECHSAQGGNKGGVNLETYDSVRGQLTSIRDQVATSRMPRNRPALSSQEKEMLFAWIDAGGPKD